MFGFDFEVYGVPTTYSSQFIEGYKKLEDGSFLWRSYGIVEKARPKLVKVTW
jgi:hypothetical protein